jgi:hypothetical protein
LNGTKKVLLKIVKNELRQFWTLSKLQSWRTMIWSKLLKAWYNNSWLFVLNVGMVVYGILCNDPDIGCIGSIFLLLTCWVIKVDYYMLDNEEQEEDNEHNEN